MIFVVKTIKRTITLFVFPLLLSSCGSSQLEYTLESKLNPNKTSPLTAIIHLKANKPCTATFRVLGESPVEQTFSSDSNDLDIPVVGLYPDKQNVVALTIKAGDEVKYDTVLIKTYKIPDGFPTIEIDQIDTAKMEPGMHLVDLHLANHGVFESKPMIFDNEGVIRWYLDLGFFGDIIWPIQRAQNGSLLLGGKNEVYEYDMLGKVLSRYSVDESYRIHHDIVELPNGQLLMPIRKADSFIEVNGEQLQSLNDFFVLFDREKNTIVKEWDMAETMCVGRRDIIHTTNMDWLHMNALAFDPSDSTILVSGKNQGLAKITWDNELVWILAPNKGWGKAGRKSDGFETEPFVLTAVDADGKPFGSAVQTGSASAENFDFPWGQHAPEILPNGDILLFDNGYSRHFVSPELYSRGVQYRVNETDKTVQQIWQFGKERGPKFFSMLISDVDLLPETENILVTAGFVDNYGKIVEVDPKTNEELFEATLNFKTLNGNKTFTWGELDIMYRSERFDLQY